MRRGRRTTRWPSCWGSGIRAGRRSIGCARQGRDDRFRFPGDAADPRRSQRAVRDRLRSAAARRRAPHRLQLQRAEDRGAAPRPRAHGTAAAAWHGRRCRREDVADICASFQRVVVEALLDRHVRSGARGSAREASASPAASRRTAACAPTRRRAARRPGVPVFVPPLALSTDNAAMIGAAGLRRYRAGIVGSLGIQRRSLAARYEPHEDLHRLSLVQHQAAPGIHPHHRRGRGDRQEERRRRRRWCWCRRCTSPSGVYVNDWEDGLIDDFQVWLEKLAPAGLPYRHHQTGEDNADAHLKRTIMGHQVMVPITKGKLDLGPWEQIFYAEFDGQRRKRVVVKVLGCVNADRVNIPSRPDRRRRRRHPGRRRRCGTHRLASAPQRTRRGARQAPVRAAARGSGACPAATVEVGETLEAGDRARAGGRDRAGRRRSGRSSRSSIASCRDADGRVAVSLRAGRLSVPRRSADGCARDPTSATSRSPIRSARRRSS